MLYNIAVAPFAGAWIEMITDKVVGVVQSVAPFAGAWIEIAIVHKGDNPDEVAPFAGAWIEINFDIWQYTSKGCRSLRGSVD